MPQHSRTNRGNGGRRSKKSAGGKELSKAALRSIVKNEDTAEEFLSALERGEKPPSFTLAKVDKVLGGGRFIVVSPETGPVRATLEGLFAGRGDFWKTPGVSTAVLPHGYVVVEDIGLGRMAAGGHHRIVAILDREQARRGLRMLGRRATTRSSNASSMGNFEFEREEQEEAEAAMRGEAVGAASAALAALRRGRTARKRTSSGKTARSSESNVSSDPNWAKLSEEKKADAKHAKLTRRKERRRAKKVGGSAWSWFSF
jgi:hypothetical protein